MTKKRRLVAYLAISLTTLMASGAYFAMAKGGSISRKDSSASLFHEMDIDNNGLVSKGEFIRFMSQEFDRLDVDHSGSLTPRELSRIRPRFRSGAKPN